MTGLKSLLGNFLLGALSFAILYAGQPVLAKVEPPEAKGVNLTIYNQNFALVKDIRDFELKEGINYLRFEDVAAKIDPTSVSFQSLTAPNAVVVREQNYQYDLIDPDSILAKSIGKNVKFFQFLPNGQMHELSGVLISSPQIAVSDRTGAPRGNGLVIRTAQGIVLNPHGQVELAELPSGLISKPSLLWKLECKKPGKHLSQISYQTEGMNWNCDYIVVLNEDDSKADLTSWVSLVNNSGASFDNAALKLVAGDVHRVQPPSRRVGYATAMVAQMPPPPQFEEQNFAEYHLYALSVKTDVKNNETKQLSLFSASDVPVQKRFVFEAPDYVYGWQSDGPQSEQKVKVKLEVENSDANHLGIPLPKGKVRVYKKDKDGALQFVGEDNIDHTPRDEKIRIYIGDAFDVLGERKQISTQQVSGKIRRAAYQIDLRNHKTTDVTVVDVEHAQGDWKIVSSTVPYVKKDGQTFEFTQLVKAGSGATIRYEIETRN